MSTFTTSLSIIVLILILSIVWIFSEINSLKKQLNERKSGDPETLKLQLQAYERITVLSERISLQSLLSRVAHAGRSSREMQMALIDQIKEEYDYNVSQQIYIAPEIWKAINNLKEQNIYIVNQLTDTLPSHASSMDLNKQIIDFLINNPKASLHTIVMEAINYEAKKLM